MGEHGFNDGLGEKLRAVGNVPERTGKTARIAAAVVIALIAVGVVSATRLWIGS